MRSPERQQGQQRALLARRHPDDIPVHARLDRAEDRDLKRHGHGQHYARSHAV
jgi:hypothetical protein